MERVAFLVEETNERIDCQLNPETVEVARLAGLRPRGTSTGRLTGSGLADDPLHFTGGGRTELRLDLLFDVDVVETPPVVADVRALTRPFWMLAENSAVESGTVRPPAVRFVWGKSWNVPTVVAAVAERFDRFDQDGVPRRSWLRVKLLRIADSAAQAQEQFETLPDTEAHLAETAPGEGLAAFAPSPEPSTATGSVVAVGDAAVGDEPPAVRFDQLATDALGNPMLWRLLAAHNHIDDPTRVPPGAVLAIPPGLDRGGPGSAGGIAGWAAGLAGGLAAGISTAFESGPAAPPAAGESPGPVSP